MNNSWIALQSIPREGKRYLLEDQSLWQTPMQEFGLTCRIVEPVRADIFILPQEQGVLFRGTLTGKVALPCDRCADESLVDITGEFDSFEPYPAESFSAPSGADTRRHGGKAQGKEDTPEQEEADDEVDEAVIRLASSGRGIEVNPAALAWEEFSLALPVKPLCKDNCKGLCPECGVNRNTETCACGENRGDPRLAVLRGLTLSKK